MRFPWALCLFVLLTLLSARPAAMQVETLEAVLLKAGIPTVGIADSDLQHRITSFAVSEHKDPVLAAYFFADDTGNPERPLHLIRYSAEDGIVRRSAIHQAPALFMHELPSDCLGSVMSIRETSGRIYVHTHKNPSAGCTLVLSKSLALESSIHGWIKQALNERFLIIWDSMVHFSPTHPTRLSIYDSHLAKLTSVYPAKNDAAHTAYSNELRHAITGSRGCMETGRICDETLFENDIVGSIAVNASENAFAFIVRFRPDQFGERAQRLVGSRDVVYAYRYVSGAWDYRSFSLADMQAKFKTASLIDLIAGSASMSFETPKDAPGK